MGSRGPLNIVACPKDLPGPQKETWYNFSFFFKKMPENTQTEQCSVTVRFSVSVKRHKIIMWTVWTGVKICVNWCDLNTYPGECHLQKLWASLNRQKNIVLTCEPWFALTESLVSVVVGPRHGSGHPSACPQPGPAGGPAHYAAPLPLWGTFPCLGLPRTLGKGQNFFRWFVSVFTNEKKLVGKKKKFCPCSWKFPFFF